MSSLFRRAVSGLGAGLGALSARYIDEESQRNKAAFMAELQRTTAQAMRQDEDAFRNDPSRVARDRANKVADIEAEGGARNKTSLMGKVAEAQSPELLDAEAKRTGVMAKATADAVRQTAKDAAADTEFLKAQGAIKLADPEVAARIAASRASAAAAYAGAEVNRAQAEGVRLSNADKKKLDELYSQASSTLSDAKIDDAERARRMAKIERQIVLMKSKTGQAAARDPELDTQTVTEERINDDGTTTKVTRKEVRRPGAQSSQKEADDPIKAAMDAARAAKAPKAAAAPAGPRSMLDTVLQTPLEQRSDAELRAYTTTHPDYARAQAELQRRQGYGATIDNQDRYRSRGP